MSVCLGQVLCQFVVCFSMVLSLVVSRRRCFSYGFVFQRCFVCLFRQGFVFVLGCYFDVVGNRSLSTVLCVSFGLFSVLLRIAVSAVLRIRFGLCF